MPLLPWLARCDGNGKVSTGLLHESLPRCTRTLIQANAVQLELQSDRLLRCNNCRAYFNLYCKVAADGASYACSLCSTKNGLNAEQRGKLEGPERSAASYTVYPPERYPSIAIQSVPRTA